MTKKSVVAAINETAFDCPHCGAYTTQYWYALHARQREEKSPLPVSSATVASRDEIESRGGVTDEQKVAAFKLVLNIHKGFVFLQDDSDPNLCRHAVYNLHISKCYNCGRFGVWVHNRLVHPPSMPAVAPNPDLPEDILADFDEARSIVNGSPRGAAALLRLCVQKLCVHLGEKGKSIDDDIASLVKRGLSPVVQQSLDVVRVIGNEAVHPGTIDLRDDPRTATSLFDLVNVIAAQMISQPKQAADLYAKLPQAKRDAIDKRDKRRGPPTP